jgi:hypothetical protein
LRPALVMAVLVTAIHAAPPLNKSAIGAGVAKAQKLTNAGVFVLCC